MNADTVDADVMQAQAAYLLTHACAVNDEVRPAHHAELMKVQAFIIKVKHAAIKRETPCTFRLLAEAGIELAFFQFFARDYLAARRSGPLPRLPHLALLRHAFRRFQDGGELIPAMFEHEYALCTDLATHSARLPDGAFIFEGACVLASSDHDLPAICNQQGSAAVHRGRHYFLYQQTDSQAATRVLELDALSAAVLLANGGATTTDAVAWRLCEQGATMLSSEMVETVFDALCTHGLGTLRDDAAP